MLRAQRGRIAAVITANDWQSPSYLHAGRSAAGRFTGAVVPHSSDYKRDRHHDAAAYEREYLRRHLPDPPCAVHAFMTACGMAAVTTVLAWLREEGGLAGGLVVGRGVYHETKELLERARGRPLATVDETSEAALGAAIDQHAPGAVFLDSVGNSSGMPVPDLDPVIRRLGATGRDAWLVVDNSGASPLHQPLARAPRRLGRLRIVVVESLTKYAQLGLDRTTAGIITAAGDGVERLSEHRERLGTNVLDHSVHTLPWPDRHALSRRLGRIERNATLLAERLHSACGPTARVSHPTLRHHHAYGRPLPFRGGFLTIDLCPASAAGSEERFVRRAIAQAEAAGVPLAAGTSFGLDMTRVYAPRVARSERGRLLRVAAGTEDRLAVEAVAAALVAAARELGRRPINGRARERPPPSRAASRTSAVAERAPEAVRSRPYIRGPCDGGSPSRAFRVLGARRRLPDRRPGGACRVLRAAGARPHRPWRDEWRGGALQGLPQARNQADHRCRGLSRGRPGKQCGAPRAQPPDAPGP